MNPRIISRERLSELSDGLHNQGKKIVFTNGCFDILHPGHAHYLEASREFGDVLIVGVNSDNSVRRLKGPTRPVNSENDRAELLAALRAVDYVTIYPEDTADETIRLVKPNIYTKGGTTEAGKVYERATVEACGGEIILLPATGDQSTTKIIDRAQYDKI